MSALTWGEDASKLREDILTRFRMPHLHLRDPEHGIANSYLLLVEISCLLASTSLFPLNSFVLDLIEGNYPRGGVRRAMPDECRRCNNGLRCLLKADSLAA